MSCLIDTTTDWIRNPSDERAVESGCRFDAERGAWTVYWIERYCRLYEGERFAGEPLILRGCHQCDSGLEAIEEWDVDCALARASAFGECVRAGHAVDWQYECIMRMFGWVHWSKHWDREVRRFRQASIWVPKKNKKSPTLAALGLYLLAGDGEPGQKVFFGAKDGTQAREICGQHALEMVRQSAELNDECSINMNLMRIMHNNSRSFMQPMSSSNARTQKSKEGINGSILIDETHVVDREFIARISRAGISRPEPFHIEVSTAGDDPDSYGASRFDRACKVISGEIVDEQLFAAVYAAPQDLRDADLAEDPVKFGRMANPAFTHTIDEAEFLADYSQSKNGTVDEFGKFKMYRLNIWQQSANPWLKYDEWLECGADYTEEDLLGRECCGGLDLSLRWDTTALVLVYPWGQDAEGHDKYRLWPYFFLPQEAANKTRHLVPWFDWEKRGWIKITDGDVTDFPLVRQTICRARDKFDLREVGYDDRFAESLAQELQDDDAITMLQHNQTPAMFLEPIGLFENLVRSKRIEHPKNDCLTWQARNAVKNRKGMLEKPEDSDHKKIDGVVAALMGLGRAVHITGSYWNPEDGILL